MPLANGPQQAGRLLLVDASSYLFRAWFGVPDAFFDRRGRPLNAVVGFSRTLGQMLAVTRPDAVAVAFDEALFSGFRHRLDPAYKANRVLDRGAAAWLGIDPVRLSELQALTGDAGDNIPGLSGFGPVSARAVLAEVRARARLNFRLVTLATCAPGLPPLAALRYQPPAAATVSATLRALGLPPGGARAYADVVAAAPERGAEC